MRWHYAPGQRELGMLHAIVRRGFAVNRHVDYAAVAAPLSPGARFRPAPSSALRGELLLTATGEVTATDAEGRALGVVRFADGSLSIPRAELVAEIEVRAREGEPAALLVDGAWEVQARDAWHPTDPREPVGDEPPHAALEPASPLALVPDDGLWRSDGPVLGRVVIRADARADVRPVLATGESRTEALAADAELESRHDLVEQEPGVWASLHELGLRWARVDGSGIRSVTVLARRRAFTREGAFRCSDDRLTAVWDAAALTLRTCAQGLMLDGIKRDRMPWMGDQALTALADAFVTGDAGIVADGIRALTQLRHGYVNGIADYSVWALVAAGTLVRWFGADAASDDLVEHLEGFADDLAAWAGDDGLLRPGDEADTFIRVFLDWGVEVDSDRDPTALQMLWVWGLRSLAAVVASRDAASDGTDDAVDPATRSARWTDLADRATAALLARAWDPERGCWRLYVDAIDAAPAPHAALLAVLAGVSTGAEPGVAAAIERAGRVGTPFMTAFVLLAMSRTDRAPLAVPRLRDWWGPMLDAGATTFAEDFPDPGHDPLAMYGRPFGRSLCHGWSSGPAALLPMIVLGIAPTAGGWSTFTVAPRLGDLAWAEAVVPAPQGDIRVRADRSAVEVEVPAGCVLERQGQRWVGPAVARWEVGGGAAATS